MVEEDIQYGGNIPKISEMIASCITRSFTKVLDWLLRMQKIMLRDSSTICVLSDELKAFNHCNSIKKVLKDHNLL
jgi:hypothetical protein